MITYLAKGISIEIQHHCAALTPDFVPLQWCNQSQVKHGLNQPDTYLCPSTDHNPHSQCHHGRYSSSCALDCSNNPNSYFTHNVTSLAQRGKNSGNFASAVKLRLQHTSEHISAFHLRLYCAPSFVDFIPHFPQNFNLTWFFSSKKGIKKESTFKFIKVISYAFPHSHSVRTLLKM